MSHSQTVRDCLHLGYLTVVNLSTLLSAGRTQGNKKTLTSLHESFVTNRPTSSGNVIYGSSLLSAYTVIPAIVVSRANSVKIHINRFSSKSPNSMQCNKQCM